MKHINKYGTDTTYHEFDTYGSINQIESNSLTKLEEQYAQIVTGIDIYYTNSVSYSAIHGIQLHYGDISFQGQLL